jgi:hypothetical protein
LAGLTSGWMGYGCADAVERRRLNRVWDERACVVGWQPWWWWRLRA